jgi:hypothetical protein
MINTPDTLGFSAAILLGLIGSTHCIGMCGGISGALGASTQTRSLPSRLSIIFGYNLGRISSYAIAGALLGALIGSVGGLFANYHQLFSLAIRTIAGLLLIAMGCYIAGWWYGLTYLEKAGQSIWKHIQPHASGLIPVNSLPKAAIAGLLWGWLPCGLVYSTLSWAATSADWQTSALLMFGFGIGTLPAMISTGLLAAQVNKLLQRQAVRKVLAMLIILFGLWTIIGALPHAMHTNHQSPAATPGENHDMDHTHHH